MEKYGQYRDKGSGIAPFFPISPPPSSPLLLPWHIFVFSLRVPLLVVAWAVWLALIQWLPPGSILRKANQWCVLGIPGVWWIDLQVDGVRRGSLARRSASRLPGPGTIIASSYTSPLDVLYLAAIFDPVFTIGQPKSKLVRPVSIDNALASCFCVQNPLELGAAPQTDMVELSTIVQQNPGRVIVVFPEGTTSNGRGILNLSPSLLSAANTTKIYPVSIRYTPSDVVTPIPGWLEAIRFVWRLNSRPTHCIRVRIGNAITSPDGENGTPVAKASGADRPPAGATSKNGFESNFFDTLQASPVQFEGESDAEDGITKSEQEKLDQVADTLARLGRVKRVNLGVEEKARFIEAWTKSGRSR